MIAYLSGKIIASELTGVTLLTSGGVGYEILVSESTGVHITEGEVLELYIYHHITEGHQALFGFQQKSEKILFQELIKISGVGGKVALQMLSLGSNRLIQAVQSGDNKTIESIKGIGKKMAEKVILELKDSDFPTVSGSAHSEASFQGFEDVMTPLLNMGYRRDQIESVLDDLPEDMESIEEILPYVIKQIAATRSL